MNENMRQFIILGLCPCGCMRPVENNHFWATDRCARQMNKKGKTMPHRYEKKQRDAYRRQAVH